MSEDTRLPWTGPDKNGVRSVHLGTFGDDDPHTWWDEFYVTRPLRGGGYVATLQRNYRHKQSGTRTEVVQWSTPPLRLFRDARAAAQAHYDQRVQAGERG